MCLESDLRARQALSDMGRIELEDKYLRLLEEMFVRSTSYESGMFHNGSLTGIKEACQVTGGQDEENGH